MQRLAMQATAEDPQGDDVLSAARDTVEAGPPFPPAALLIGVARRAFFLPMEAETMKNRRRFASGVPLWYSTPMAAKTGQWEAEIREAVTAALEGSAVTSLAARAGIPRETLSRFLNGRRGLSLAAAEALASSLGLSLRRDNDR